MSFDGTRNLYHTSILRAVVTRNDGSLLRKQGHWRCKSSMPIDDSDDYQQDKKLIPFLLADIGEGIAEVEVLQWYVQPGDDIKQFDKVCEVQSDKATVEITSRFDGIVESLADASDMVRVGTPLLKLWVDAERDDHRPVPPTFLHNVDEEQDKLHIPTFASSFQQQKVLTTPAVRKLSREYNLDLGNIVGTGPKGRVLKADVLQMLQHSGRLVVPKEDNKSSEMPPVVEATESKQVETQKMAAIQDETVPIRGYNRLMVKTMTESLSIPHMCYADEINMNQVLQARKSVNGIKLSVLPFAIKAASLAMTDYPVLNSSLNLDEMTLTYHANHNIGVAMDTPRGLAVPVIKACQNLSILEIAQELDRLKLKVCFVSDGVDTLLRNTHMYIFSFVKSTHQSM